MCVFVGGRLGRVYMFCVYCCRLVAKCVGETEDVDCPCQECLYHAEFHLCSALYKACALLVL